jgi:hypothetical protein
MANTAAQRQAAYRARRSRAGRDGNGERQLNMWVNTEAALGLARLARRAGVTQREMVERLVMQADKQVLAGLDPDAPGWDVYFGVRAAVLDEVGVTQ